MNSEHNEKIGTVKIGDDVIAICALNATLRTKGVADFGHASDNFSKGFFGKEQPSKGNKGIKVFHGDAGISLDIYVIVDYGVKIPAVAWDIQENVKKQIEEMTDSPVNAVNIHVQGVRMESEGNSKNEQSS